MQLYYPFIDGLRCVACCLVIWHHVHVLFGLHFNGISGYLAYYGFFGVDLFFVISGFLITGLLWDEGRAPDLKQFYWRRFFKIVPIYYLVLFAAVLVKGMPAVGLLAGQLFFFQNYLTRVPLMDHTWSLAIEEHFYLLYPWVIVLVHRCCQTPKNRLRCLAWILGMALVGLNVYRGVFFGSSGIIVDRDPAFRSKTILPYGSWQTLGTRGRSF